MKIKWSKYSFDLSQRTHIMGILNVTPDSFSDGGFFFDREAAIEHALQMQEDGADIIDIGGESTRPGARKVSAKEEIKRVLPVIKALYGNVKVPISIDTYKSEVAEAAINAGASIVNDISGLRFDKKMPKLVAKHKVPIIMMHIKGTPEDMQQQPTYKALIPEIIDYLAGSINIARDAGITEDMMSIDPGIGFGKSFDHNLEIIDRLNEFTGFEKPILLGTSRKAFIGNILGGLPAEERIEGTAASVAIGIINGADIIRVHDVREMARVAKVADAVKRSSFSNPCKI